MRSCQSTFSNLCWSACGKAQVRHRLIFRSFTGWRAAPPLRYGVETRVFRRPACLERVVLRAVELADDPVPAVTTFVYFTCLDGSFYGQTVGKWLCGIRVQDFATGELIGLKRGALRTLSLFFLSSPPFFLGFFWAARDKEKQSWHDKIARSVVALAGRR